MERRGEKEEKVRGRVEVERVEGGGAGQEGRSEGGKTEGGSEGGGKEEEARGGKEGGTGLPYPND